MYTVIIHMRPYRGRMLRERPVEEAREVAASFMRVSYTVYGEGGRAVAEGEEEGVMEVEIRGTTRYSPGIGGDMVAACLVDKGRIYRRGSLVVVE